MTDAEILYMRQVLVDAPARQLLPTVALQLESLTRFMNAVGYSPVGEGGQNFILKDKSQPLPEQLNWEKAVRLHNYGVFIRGYDHYEVAVPLRPYNATSVYILENEIWQTKVVQSVYLQWSKKKKCWLVTQDRIKFVNPEEPCLKDASI